LRRRGKSGKKSSFREGDYPEEKIPQVPETFISSTKSGEKRGRIAILARG